MSMEAILRDCIGKTITLHMTSGIIASGSLVDVYNDEVAEIHGRSNIKFMVRVKHISVISINPGDE